VKVYPVIHVTGVESAVAEVATAVRHGIAGVFLIDHDADDARLVLSIVAIAEAYPGLFLGANFIRRPIAEALSIMDRSTGTAEVLSAIWSDNAGLDALLHDPAQKPPVRPPGWRGLHFGGVAFKYQAAVPVAQLPRLGELARAHVDVATTSGPGTGMHADLRRLHALREGLGDHPLALASGVTPENVVDYFGLVDHILVATGIARTGGGIDERKLDLLLQNVERARARAG
jgi:hypothetical protein